MEDAAGTDGESAAKSGAEAGVETSAADSGCVTGLEGADWAVANTTAARARQDQVSRAVTTIPYGLVLSLVLGVPVAVESLIGRGSVVHQVLRLFLVIFRLILG